MKCPKCNKHSTQVFDSRTTRDSVRRRRQCLRCNHKFTTHELPTISDSRVAEYMALVGKTLLKPTRKEPPRKGNPQFKDRQGQIKMLIAKAEKRGTMG